jgi:uncharacterized protein YndB with AHSA1/START domain
MNRDIVLEVTYPAPVESVWRAITDSVLLKEWLMDNDFAAVTGTKCQFRMKPQPGFAGVIDCEVLEVEPHRRLVYTWDGGGSWGKTLLTWTLEVTAAGTKLTLEHRGFHGFRPFLLGLMMQSGWKKKLTKIVPELLARLTGPEETRVAAR